MAVGLAFPPLALVIALGVSVGVIAGVSFGEIGGRSVGLKKHQQNVKKFKQQYEEALKKITLDEDATDEEIEEAKRNLLLLHHPDKHANNPQR